MQTALMESAHDPDARNINFAKCRTNQDCSYDALFQFARIIRNTASHKTKGILGEWPKGLSKKGVTEVTWRNKTFSKERDVGKEVFLTHHEAVLLHWDMRQYALSNLN